MTAWRIFPIMLAAAALLPCPAAARLPEGVVATPDNWGAVVGFAPDPGATPEAMTPPGLSALVGRGLKPRVVPYRPMRPSLGYIEATNRHHAAVTAVETGPKDIRTPSLRGYVAGLPFPAPETGLEVAWNMQHAYAGDDGVVRFGVYLISATRGVTRSEEWVWETLTRASHRTDLEPLPAFPEAAARHVQYASLAWAEAPYDKAGAIALYYRHDDPRDQGGFLYIPSMRRSLRMTFGAPGIPWNQTDLLFEDIRGYSGHPEWMTWKLLGRATVLAPMHANTPVGRDAAARVFDFEHAPHWNPTADFEPRPVYILEGRPKFWTCPYSRVVLYVDAESYLVPLKEGYDKKGRLWKVVMNAFNESPDPDRLPSPLAFTLAVDLLAGHATAVPTIEVRSNIGLTPARFTESEVRRIGR